MRYKHIIIFLILILSYSAGYSQPRCKVRIFGTEEGLPAGFLSGITQSTDNLLWITSWNGLTCFDGYHFTTFRNVPGKNLLPTNHLKYMVAGIQGNLWTETYTNEIFLFDSKRCKFVKIEPKTPTQKNETANKRNQADKEAPTPLSLRKFYPLANGHTWLVSNDQDHYRVTDSIATLTDKCIEHFYLPGKLQRVCLDSHGNEWCFTTAGTYLDGKTQVSKVAYDFIIEVEGKTWFASPDGQLGILNGKTVLPHRLTNTVSRINRCLVINNRTIAFGTDRGVLLVDSRTMQETLIDIQSPNNQSSDIEEMRQDSRGRLWCFNNQPGVTLVNPVTRQCLWLDAHLPGGIYETPSDCNIVHEDNNHTIWVTPKGGTFAYFDEERQCLVAQRLRASLSNSRFVPRITRTYSDTQGNLWLGSVHNVSLVNFYHSNIDHVDRGDLRDTRAILQTQGANSITFTGTYNGLCTAYDNQWNVLSSKTVAQNIYCIFIDSRGRRWMGTKGEGVIMIDKSGKEYKFRHDATNPYSLSCDMVYDINEDTQGRVLIGSYGGGLNIVDETSDGSIRFITPNNRLKTYDNDLFYQIRRITVTPQGVVVLATTGGLLTFCDRYKTPEKIRFYKSVHDSNDETSLFSSSVMQACITNDRRLYVATIGGGLQLATTENLLSDQLKFKGIDTQSIQTVLSLVTDNSDDVWIIGDSRISRIDHKTHAIEEFGADELGDVTITEALPTHNNVTDRICLGTVGGFISFLPRLMQKSHYHPTVVFTAVNYADNTGLQPLLNTDELRVDVYERTFTIHFAALDYTDNRNIRYAYMLDGDPEQADQPWIYTRNGMHSVTFNDFPAGSHTLYVRSTNSDGVWMDNTRALHIYAQPTFIESWWGQLIITIIVASIIAYGIIFYMKRKKVEIQEEANEQADAGKIRFLMQTPEIIDEDKATMDHILEYITQHLDNSELKVDDLAHSLNISRSALYARIKRIADMTPNDFIRHVRMQRAEELVAHSHQSVSQIAYQVGFSDPKYFGKCFKKHTGMSPSEYRSKYSDQTEENDESKTSADNIEEL